MDAKGITLGNDLALNNVTMRPALTREYRTPSLQNFYDKFFDNLGHVSDSNYNNIAVVGYYEQCGKYFFRDFVNFKSKKDIINEYGKGFYNTYIQKPVSMIAGKDRDIIHITANVSETDLLNENGTITVQKEMGYTGEEFGGRITLMKKAGRNFIDTMDEVEELDIKAKEI